MRVLLCCVLALASLQTLDCLDKRALFSRLNFFDIDLLRYSADEKHGNIMVSPASVKSMLAMLLEGATGQTADEIRSALRLFPAKDDLRQQLNLYLKALQSNSSGTIIENANGIFISNKLKLKKEYESNLRYVYYSEVIPVNFGNAGVVSQQINGWVNEKTKGLIPKIVDPAQINTLTDMVVTNALYFKSSWLNAFNPQFTRTGCFYNRGLCRNVAMMELHAEMNYAYVENLRAHALELPYEGKRYSMILLIPQDRDGSSNLIRDLPFMSLPQISELLQLTDVHLSLPKFTVDYNEDIVEALKRMRISTLFSSSANLSEIFDGSNPYVSNIYHQVHMSVDEQGTVAAAASAAMVVPLINDGVELRADRPFVFFIRDNDLGLVLFEGRIEEPTEYVEKAVNHNIRVKTKRPFLGLF